MLFMPEPRAPTTYAEECLYQATCLPAYWRDFPDRLATDAQLEYLLTNWVLGGGRGRYGPDHSFVTESGLKFWAISEEEKALPHIQGHRKPDFSGRVLMDTVRELNGIWRPQ